MKNQTYDARSKRRSRLLLTAYCLLLTFLIAPFAHAQTTQTTTTPRLRTFKASSPARLLWLPSSKSTGSKVLVKRREGSQTVAAGLFIRGGVENISASNAGVEAFMLNVASEASANFPRDRMRKETARMGTVIGEGVNYDYSSLSMAATRANFDRSWEIFTDVALRPSFTKEDVALVQARILAGLQGEADDPDGYLQRLQERVAYVGHPYLNRPEGTAENVSRLTAEDLRAYHQKIMQTSRLLLVIVGDLDAAQLKDADCRFVWKAAARRLQATGAAATFFRFIYGRCDDSRSADQLCPGIVHRAADNVAGHLSDAGRVVAVARPRV